MKSLIDTPLSEWTPAWLKMETASILHDPLYILMHDHEKQAKGYPVTRDEMIVYIGKWRPEYSHNRV